MNQCKKCGKTYLVDLGEGLCGGCMEAVRAEELKNSFPCLIPDIPLTKFEKIEYRFMAPWLGRIMREARIKVTQDRLELYTEDSRGKKIEIADYSIKEIHSVLMTPVPISIQLKTAFLRTVYIGIGMGVVIVIGSLNVRDWGEAPFALVCMILFALISGIILASLLNFIPILFRIKSGLSQFEVNIDNSTIPLFTVKHAHISEVVSIFRNIGINISKANDHH